MSIRTKSRRPRSVANIYASIARRELTPETVEVAVYCRDDGLTHEVRTRRGSLARLARRPDFAGVVVQDGGKLRCPRCETKITDVRHGSTDFGEGYRVVTR